MVLPWGCGHPSLTSHARGLLTSLVTLLLLRLGSAQFRVEGPGQTVTATVGQDVVLPCHLSPRRDARSLEVRWIRDHTSETVHHYHNGQDLYGEQMEAYVGRTELVRDGLSAGSLDLRISGLRPSDDGRYICTVGDGDAYDEATVHLEVSASGADPHLSLGGYEAGGVRVLCRSAGWYPLPQLLWRDARGQHLPSVSQTHSQDQEGLFEIGGAVIVTGSVEGPLSCVVRNSRLQQERESSLHIAAPFFHNAQPWKVALALVLVLLAVSIGLGVYLFRKQVAQSQELADEAAELDEYRAKDVQQSAIRKDLTEQLVRKNIEFKEQAAKLVQKDRRMAELAAEREEKNVTLERQSARLKEQAAELVRKDTELEEQAAELAQKEKRLAELAAELEKKNARLAHQSARLKDLTEQLVRKNKELKAKEAELVRKDTELEEQAAELVQKEKRLVELKAELEKKNARLKNQSARLKDLTEQLVRKNKERKAKEAELVRKDTELEEQAAKLVQKDRRLVELAAEREEKNARLAHQSARLKDLTEKLVRKNKERKEQAAELVELKAEREEKNARLELQSARLQELATELEKKDAKLREQAAGQAWRRFLLPQNRVKLTLDPCTAHPLLVLSQDNCSVRRETERQQVPDTPERFDTSCCVLGCEEFREGRHCWLVEVEGEGLKHPGWAVGVARASVERKKWNNMSPEEGIWAVEYSYENLMSLTSPPTPLSLSPVPTRIWVCLDCTEGQVSFINHDNRVEIFAFTNVLLKGESMRPWFWLGTDGIQLCLRDSTL